jgi:hypothetical protein
MNKPDADHIFDSQMKTRWTEWQETSLERSDWTRRLMTLTVDEAAGVLRQLSDKSFGKKPNAKDFFTLADPIIKQKPKAKNYVDVPIYFVYLGGADPLSPVGRWVVGTIKSVILRTPLGTDIQDFSVVSNIISWAKEYITENYRVFADMLFEVSLDETTARQRAWKLKGML